MNEPTDKHILVLNAGSSSLKFSVFKLEEEKLQVVFVGSARGLHSDDCNIKFTDTISAITEEVKTPKAAEGEIIATLFLLLQKKVKELNIITIGHRVVHGANLFTEPTLVYSNVITKLESLIPFAPLHQPTNILLIKICKEMFPHVPQVCCFDTNFHLTQNPLAALVAIPKKYRDAGVQNYGFHGLSYEYIAVKLKTLGIEDSKVLIAHLGSGASVCAIEHGKSIATTMGFSVLNGLIMATRPGNIDPGIILYLQDHFGLSTKEVSDLLYKQSGLLGISDISGDMQVLQKNNDAQSLLAMEAFVYRVSREIGSLAAAMGGVKTIIFTGGIGENNALIRSMIASKCSWLGASLNEEANSAVDKKTSCISKQTSSVSLWVIPTDENFVIAQHALKMGKLVTQ